MAATITRLRPRCEQPDTVSRLLTALAGLRPAAPGDECIPVPPKLYEALTDVAGAVVGGFEDGFAMALRLRGTP